MLAKQTPKYVDRNEPMHLESTFIWSDGKPS